MEEKYTMEEFKAMFNKAEKEAMEDMEKNLKEVEQETGSDSTMCMTLTMHAMLFGAMIFKNLFKK